MNDNELDKLVETLSLSISSGNRVAKFLDLVALVGDAELEVNGPSLLFQEEGRLRVEPLGANTTVGRDPDCQVVVRSDFISARQFTIVHAPESDTFDLLDAGSKNGTFVNEDRLQGVRTLKPCDKISAADMAFIFVWPLADACLDSAGPSPDDKENGTPPNNDNEVVSAWLCENYEAPSEAADSSSDQPTGRIAPTLSIAESEAMLLPGDLVFSPLPPAERYQSFEPLASGGMGVVYNVRDAVLKRDVALKQALGGTSAPGRLRQFYQEAKTTACLQHHGIVPVYDFGLRPDGEAYFTMRRIDGESLQVLLERLADRDPATLEIWPLSKLVGVVQRVCETVAFAHDHGILHRDIKPANIMVGSYGEVLVVDWGLAIGLKSTLTLDTPVSADPDATQSERFVSMDGRVAGTPLYMAPEQARGDRSAFGPHTDIYALGGLLFSVLTLDPPVRGRGEKVLERVKRGEVTPLHRYKNPNLQHCPNQRIPSSLAAIAKKALSFKPEDRYQDVGSLLKDLEDTQSGFAPEAEQAGFLKRASLFVNRNKAACVIGALLGVLLTLALILWSLTSFALWQNAALTVVKLEEEKRLRGQQGVRDSSALYDAAELALQSRNYETAKVAAKRSLEYATEPDAAHELLAFLETLDGSYESAAQHAHQMEDGTPMVDLIEEVRDGRTHALALLGDMAAERGFYQLAVDLRAQSVQNIEDLVVANLADWKRNLERQSPGLGTRLQTNSSGLTLDLGNHKLATLDVLRGIPLSMLNTGTLGRPQVEDLDLEPLRGSPLHTFISAAPITDPSPILSGHLRTLDLAGNPRYNEIDWSTIPRLELDTFHLPPDFRGRLAARKVLIYKPQTDLAWLAEVEGLEVVKLNLIPDLSKKNLRPLTSIPTLREIEMLNSRARLSASTLELPHDLPRATAAELRRRIAAVRNDARFVRFWKDQWTILLHLLDRQAGKPSETPDSQIVTRIGDRMFALVHTQFVRPAWLDLLGAEEGSIHSAEENARLIDLHGQLDLPGINPLIRLGLRKAGNGQWNWNNGRELTYEAFPSGLSEMPRVFLGAQWTGQGTGTSMYLLSWPVAPPPPRDELDFVQRRYPALYRHEWGGSHYAFIDMPVTLDSARAVAEIYGGELLQISRPGEGGILSHFLGDIWTGNHLTCWTADGARQKSLSRILPASPDLKLPFIVEWANANDVPPLRKPSPDEDLLDFLPGLDRERLTYDDTEYLLVRTGMTYLRAHLLAERLGCHLADVEGNAAQRASTMAFLKHALDVDVWLGGRDAQAESVWEWTSGKPWTITSEEWHTSQPDNFGGHEDFLLLSAGSGKFNDVHGGRYVPFLIELP